MSGTPQAFMIDAVGRIVPAPNRRRRTVVIATAFALVAPSLAFAASKDQSRA